ncbi:MAG: guanylate kinase [Candidatus Doudnabacteria bacterium]|nr:guanylate kinase [Candidatus Doudnabacteria bacterium]
MTDTPRYPFFIVSGPSGVGKNTVVEGVRQAVPELQKATTYTSREPRPGELEAKMKFFVSREEFERKIQDEELFEHASYAGNYYGTPKKELLALLSEGPAMTDIETQGVKQLLETFPREKLVTIFLKPSSVEALTKRITARAPISEEELAGRVARIEEELADAKLYDHVIVNEEGKVERTIDQVGEYVRAALG